MKSIIYGSQIEISSLSQFVEKVISKTKEDQNNPYELQYLYRGHSDIGFVLEPSIARSKESLLVETRLIELSCSQLPTVFNLAEGKLNTLAKMQHYGIPTRLLDFTMNPLVALYFACQNPNVSGEILELNNHVHYSGVRISDNEDLIRKEKWSLENKEEIVMSWYYRKFFSYTFTRDLFISCIDLVPDKGIAVIDLIKKIKKEEWFIQWSKKKKFNYLPMRCKENCIAAMFKAPLVVEAQALIERQRLQQGVYLLVPNKVEREGEHYYIKKDLPPLFHKDRNIGHYTINKDNKDKILNELDMIGINEGLLFADSIDRVCQSIKNRVCSEKSSNSKNAS